MQVSCVRSTKVVVGNPIYTFSDTWVKKYHSAGGPGWVFFLRDFHPVAGPEEWKNEWGHLQGWRRPSTPVHFLRSQSLTGPQVLHLPCAPLALCGSKECHWLQGREGEGHWLWERKVRESQLFPIPLSSCSQGLHKWGQDRTGQRESTGLVRPDLPIHPLLGAVWHHRYHTVESLGILFPFSKGNQPGVTATRIQVDLQKTVRARRDNQFLCTVRIH